MPFALALFVIAGVTAEIAILSFHRPQQTGARSFGWLNVGMMAWSFFYALELLASPFSTKLIFAKLEYIGISIIPFFWFVFAMEFNGRKDWLTRTRRVALFIVPAITMGLAFINSELHQYIWQEITIDKRGYPALLISAHGVWFWVFITYTYLMLLGGMAPVFINFFQSPAIVRKQLSLMIIGAITPLATNIIYIIQPWDLYGLDFTPFGFAVSSMLTFVGFFRLKFFRLTPVASVTVLENLRDAAIILDDKMRVVDFNAAAREWWRLDNTSIGREAQAVLPVLAALWDNWSVGRFSQRIQLKENGDERFFDASLLELYGSSKAVTGWVALIRDVTREQSLLSIEFRYARQMEILNSITKIALEEKEFDQLLDSLAEHLGELLDADGAYITLWDDEKQQTIPITSDAQMRGAYKKLVIEQGETTLTASVLREKRILVVEDVHNTPYMSPRIAAQFPTKSMMALPLIADGRKLGAALIGFNQPHIFNEREVALGEQAAAQLALALNKSQLLEKLSRRVGQLSLLQQVSERLVKSLDEKEIYQIAIQAIADIFGYDEAAISLVTENNQLELVSIGGLKDYGFERGFRQEIGQGIMGHVAKTSKPYYTASVEHDDFYYHPQGQGAGAAIGVPMRYEDKLIGVVYIQNATPNSIIEDDIPVLKTLANHLASALQNARLFADVHDHLIAANSLQSISQIVTSSLDLEKIFTTVVTLLQENYEYNHVSIYQLEGDVLRLGAQVGYPADLVIHEIRITSGVTGRAIRTRQTQFLPNVKDDPSFLRASHEVQSEICVPLVKDKIVLGVLNVESTELRPLTQKDVELLDAFARPVAMAVDNARLHARVKSLALTDGLTSLINRRAFDQVLETEVARAIRYAHPLSLIIVDIDSFKGYNDLHGHPAGDERIKAIAEIFTENVRHPDIAARYGGEEFAIILPHTDKTGALVMAERLRIAAASQSPDNVPSPGHPIAGYTISLGVATFPHDGKTSKELLLAADNAELHAKRLGKNQTSAATMAEKPHQ
jgi:diguanylate cyclase (GGDEF)-like protein